MKVPPRWVRRVIQPVLLAGLAFAVTFLPLLVVVAAAASHWLPGKWRALRLLWFALVYIALECAGMLAAFALWIASGFGWKLRAPRFQRAHYAVLRGLLSSLVRIATHLFKLDVVTDDVSWSPLDDGVPGSENAMLVLSRHAGPGDSFLLAETLMNRDHLRRPRIVLKDTLQWDPMVDIYLNRLPSRFIDPTPGAGAAVPAAIASIARDLGDEDALLIFPEGGNYTPRRRMRAIERFRNRGMHAQAQQAEALAHVLPPRPAGVAAALEAAPHADVVFVAHTGLEHLNTIRDIWHELPMDKTLRLRWTFVPCEEVPRDRATVTDWLNRWWNDIDRWIDEHREDLPTSAG